MNAIETKFYETFKEKYPEEFEAYYVEPQHVIGQYRVDFLYDNEYIIEIDGHEYHKTKEQRGHDYKRERYLLKRGYKIIRFTGTEVFTHPEKCVEELLEIQNEDIWRFMDRLIRIQSGR